MKNDILDKRINLESQGISGDVWKITDCKDVIEWALFENKVILGGEILALRNGEYLFESSNWYYNGNSCDESVKRAKEYFSKWDAKPDQAVLFVFKSL